MNNSYEELINRENKFYDIVDAKYKDYLWNLRLINIESLWNAENIENMNKIKIAVIDSGVDLSHPDLQDIKKRGYNFIDNNFDLSDKFGHGTKINGVIAAPKNGIGICGIVSDAKIYNLKVINEDGKGRVKNIINAFKWSIEQKMDIINMSIGHSVDVDCKDGDDLNKLLIEEKKIVEEAIKRGIIIVSSIGNVKDASCQAPACFDGVIQVASYGVKNTKPMELYPSKLNSICDESTIYAPGEYVFTSTLGDSYGYDCGSSIATAHITGIIAYLKAINSKLNSSQIHNILLETSLKIKIEDNVMNIVNTEMALNKVRNCLK